MQENTLQYIDTEVIERCPLCSSGHISFLCNSYDRLHNVSEQQFCYSKCLECGAIFQSLRPAETEIGKFYPENYGPYKKLQSAGSSKHASEKNGCKQNLSESFLKRIRKHLKLKARKGTLDAPYYAQLYTPPSLGAVLLDFGCGSDKFLNQARLKGWQTLGMDFSESVVHQVRASGHQSFLVSKESWEAIEDNSISFIRMNHVLEHLYSPVEVLAQICRKLKPQGILHVATPNPSSITFQLFRSRWFSLDCPRHIILFPPRTLKEILLKIGFDPFRILHEAVTKDFARSLGYLWFDQGRITQAEINGMMHRKFLHYGLYMPAKMAALLRISDRFHIFAKKQN